MWTRRPLQAPSRSDAAAPLGVVHPPEQLESLWTCSAERTGSVSAALTAEEVGVFTWTTTARKTQTQPINS